MDYIFVWYAWLALALLLLILEIIIPGFVLACFSVGALASALMAAFGFGVNVQLITFAVLTLLVFALIRPFTLKYLMGKRKGGHITTNSDALPDRIGRVVSSIDNATMRGEVKVDGDIFMARSVNGLPIELGSDVKIVKIDSTILIVEKIQIT